MDVFAALVFAVPWFLRPDWVTVWATLLYTLVAALTWRVIRRQMKIMEEQAQDARAESKEASATALQTLRAIKRQGVSMRRQTTHIRKSAEAGEVAARAAMSNVQAVINSERPWLTVSIRDDPENTKPFPAYINVLKNEGRTPAKIRSAYFNHVFIPNPDDLPETPEEPVSVKGPEKRLVVGGSAFSFGVSFKPGEILFRHQRSNGDRGTRSFLVFYGRVVYEDVLEVSGEAGNLREHQTRWCYVWVPEDKAFYACGPDSYNSYT